MELKLMIFERGFFCINLRSSAILILFLGQILSILNLLTSLILLEPQHSSSSVLTKSAKTSEEIAWTLQFFANSVTMGLIPCSIGLFGVLMRKPSCLKIYVICGIIDLIRFSISVMLLLSVYFQRENVSHFFPDQWKLFDPVFSVLHKLNERRLSDSMMFVFISIFFQWYCLCVTNSHYLELKERVKFDAGFVFTAPSAPETAPSAPETLDALGVIN